MPVFILWVAAIAVAVYFYLRQQYSTFSRAGVKNLPTVPLLGNMAACVLKREHLSQHIEKLYFGFPTERFVGRFDFVKPSLLVRDIEMIRKVVVKDFDHFVDHRTLIDPDIDPLFARNVFTMRGEEWKDMRSALSPAFTSSKMKLMVPFMVDVGTEMMACLKQQIKNNGGDMDVHIQDLCTRFANDVIASCAFGTKVNSHKDVDNYFYSVGKDISNFDHKAVLKFIGFNTFPKIMAALKITFTSEKSRNFFRNLILGSIKKREDNNIVRNDLIHLLMEAQKGKLSHESLKSEADADFAVSKESTIGKRTVQRDWADDDLVAQAVVFFVAGFDTVSTAMSWLLYELALNPDVQDRLYQEIKENDIRNGGKLDYNSIQQMKYLDMVLSESLRKWPPVVWLDRICTKDYNCGKPNDKAQKDFILRKGQGLNIPVWPIHRDPQYYPNPTKFDPERFSDENKGKIDPFTYMPFGLGPRNCIGSRFAIYEVKVLAYTLLQQLEISPSEKTCLTEELDKNIIMNLRLKGGNFLKFKSRN